MPPDLPRFSLRLHQGLTPQACGALAASAEAHGFHTLWFAENPFGRAVLPAVAACAADTSRVRLGLDPQSLSAPPDPDCAGGGGAR